MTVTNIEISPAKLRSRSAQRPSTIPSAQDEARRCVKKSWVQRNTARQQNASMKLAKQWRKNKHRAQKKRLSP